MKIITDRKVELTRNEADIKQGFEAYLGSGWTVQQAVARLKELHADQDPALWRWLAGESPLPEPSGAVKLSEWCIARLSDSRESGEVDEDVSDAVIEREAAKLEVLIFQLASSFVDNEFDDSVDRIGMIPPKF